MHPSDSKIADLLPRIVERAARRSDEKEEEPWVKPQQSAGTAENDAAPRLPGETSVVMLPVVLLPAILAFVTAMLAKGSYPVAGVSNGQLMHCLGAPLVYKIEFNHLGQNAQYYAGALILNGLMWVAIAAAIWWAMHRGITALLPYWFGGRRRFTIGQLLALSVGIAMAFSAWRWDLALAEPWHTTLAAVEKAYELGMPAGPQVQPLFRYSLVAAAVAYLGVGCAGMCLVSGGLWVIRQFLPRRPGEDKSLLQQIF